MMRNIALLTEYDGTSFHGWQSQKGLRNVQDEIRRAIGRCTGEEVRLTGCSRTDAGVHAIGHVSNFFTGTRIPVDKLPLALNSNLPADISIHKAAEVSEAFHARFGAQGKRYRYRIYCSPVRPALDRHRVCHITGRIDVDAILQAAPYFEGTHDFSAFMASGSEVKSAVRTIYSIQVIQNGPKIDIIVHGDGFLYNMVRIIAGTLYYAGIGKILPGDIEGIIGSCDRRKAGKTLPARGLYLEEVFYGIDIFGEPGSR